MAEEPFKSQMDALSKLLGKAVTLKAAPEERAQSAGASQNEEPGKDVDNEPKRSTDLPEFESIENPDKNDSKDEGWSAPEPWDGHFILEMGEHADQRVDFCTWNLVEAYPDRYIGKANRPRAKPFFDKILDNGRVWDFFYIHDIDDPFGKPFLLVPTYQFETFLGDINRALDTALTIPRHFGIKDDKFRLTFREWKAFQPRFFKHVKNPADLEVQSWPSMSPRDLDDLKSVAIHVREDWEAKMKVIKTGHKYYAKTVNQKSVNKQRAREKMMVDVQTYLGLAPDTSTKDVVFVCVDVEALEQQPNPISEIGIGILDTRDIGGIEPGPCGQDWRPLIKSHHLRVKEYAGLRNYRWVHGCPDNFLFGQSTFPKSCEVSRAISSILDPYLDASRQIVLAGHDIDQDIRYLKTLGIDLSAIKGLTGTVDSKDLDQQWQKRSQGRGLATILYELQIPCNYLHNAGNDAHYTLCAIIAVAIEQQKGENAKLEPVPS